MQKLAPLIALTLTILLAACATAPPQPPTIREGDFAALPEYLQRLIEHERQKNDITGLSIALVGQGETVWSDGFGYADLPSEQPATRTTRFRAGSVSKLFNAVKVMQLVEQKQLSLEQDINVYLPEFSINRRTDSDAPITLKNLLTHQSGLPSDLAGEMWTQGQPEPTDSVFPYLAATYLTNPPGSVFSYSNLGFDVVGEIIARTQEVDYPQAMQSLLDDLGMHDSAFSARADVPTTASGYSRNKARPELSLRDVPAGGLSTNAEDLAQVLKLFTNQGMVDGQQQLSNPSIATLLDDYTSESAVNIGTWAGLGIFHYQAKFHPSLELYSHNGATHSHRALIVFSPRHRYGVALLSNSANSANSLHRLAGKSIELLHKATYGTKAPTLSYQWPYPSEQDETAPAKLTGYYATPAGLAQFSMKDGALKGRFAGKTFNTEQHVEQGPHYLDYKLLGLISVDLGHLGNIGFSTRRAGDKTLLIGTDPFGHARVTGVRIEASPIPEAWRKRLGDYSLASDFPVVEIDRGGLSIKDGFLVARAKLKDGPTLEYVLQPVSDDQAIIAGQGRSLGETVFFRQKGNEEWFEYSGLIFKKAE